MLTREQIHTMLMLRYREGTVFNQLPIELIFEIRNFSQDSNSDFAKVLHHVAYGELNEAKTMLKANPRLVLLAGNIVTPGGLTVIRTTLLGCALGAGDAEMAAMIIPFYSDLQIEGGEEVMAKELECYRPHIEGMLDEKNYYDLRWLFNIIKESSNDDIQAALNKVENNSKLCQALIQFRNDVRPGKIKIGMHYNYQNLIHAFDMLDREWNNLKNGNNYDKCDLVWCQVIGYEQRGLPAVGRFAFARGFKAHERKLEFKHGGGSFPDTSGGDADLSGPGFDVGYGRGGAGAGLRGAAAPIWLRSRPAVVTKFMSSKNFRLRELMQPRPREKSSRCVVC